MITQQQQQIAYSELSRLFDPKEESRLTPIERAALRVALCMLTNKPAEAGEVASAMEMLVDARRRNLEKKTD